MKSTKLPPLLLAPALALLFPLCLVGQRPLEAPAVAISRCPTTHCAIEIFDAVAHPTAVRVAYYSKLLSLNPKDRSAALSLLMSMPRDGGEYASLSDLCSSLYPGESDKDLSAACGIAQELNRNLAHALREFPQFLPAFIKYGETAFADPHNDYGDWAAKICRANPKRFLRALRTLSPPDQCYFSHRIIDPHGCKEIAVPEAE